MPVTPMGLPPDLSDPPTFAARAQAIWAQFINQTIPEINAMESGLGTGVAGPYPTISQVGLTDNSIPPGVYIYNAGAGSEGLPSTISLAFMLHLRRGSGGGEIQHVWVEDSTIYARGAVLTRARQGGAWDPWVGALSAINDSSTYARAPDGRTQTCWRSLDDTAAAWTDASGSSFRRTAGYLWTFPAPFVGAVPVITGTIERSGGMAGGITIASVGLTSAIIFPFAASSLTAGTAKSFHLHAVGRYA